MKKYNIIISTLLLIICFSVFFLIDIILIPWPPIRGIIIVSRILIPTLLTIITCVIINHKRFKFSIKNITTKTSICKLLYRLLIISCFLVIGFFLDYTHINSYNYSDVINNLFNCLLNFGFYIYISFFLIIFSIVEFIFIVEKNKKI